MDTPALSQHIIETVRRHYATSTEPYWLSLLGGHISANGYVLPNDMRLKEFIDTYCRDALITKQHPRITTNIAVALPENADAIEHVLTTATETNDVQAIDFGKLPFSLIAAFCRRPDDGKRIFYRTKPPFRYELLTEVPTGPYVEIPSDYQPAKLLGKDVHGLSQGERREIYDYVLTWANANNVALSKLYYSKSGHTQNALQRLIDAQPIDLRQEILIPADIADLLMRSD